MMSQPGEEWSNLSDRKQDLLFLMRTNSNPDTKNNSDTGLVPKASAKRHCGKGGSHAPLRIYRHSMLGLHFHGGATDEVAMLQ